MACVAVTHAHPYEWWHFASLPELRGPEADARKSVHERRYRHPSDGPRKAHPSAYPGQVRSGFVREPAPTQSSPRTKLKQKIAKPEWNLSRSGTKSSTTASISERESSPISLESARPDRIVRRSNPPRRYPFHRNSVSPPMRLATVCGTVLEESMHETIPPSSGAEIFGHGGKRTGGEAAWPEPSTSTYVSTKNSGSASKLRRRTAIPRQTGCSRSSPRNGSRTDNGLPRTCKSRSRAPPCSPRRPSCAI